MTCDNIPGFSCEISLENVQVTGHWPPQLNIGVSTDANGSQTVQTHIAGYDKYSQPIEGT
jgi:hypothetical protein